MGENHLWYFTILMVFHYFKHIVYYTYNIHTLVYVSLSNAITVVYGVHRIYLLFTGTGKRI